MLRGVRTVDLPSLAEPLFATGKERGAGHRRNKSYFSRVFPRERGNLTQRHWVATGRPMDETKMHQPDAQTPQRGLPRNVRLFDMSFHQQRL